MRTLVTGASGFIGTNIVEAFLQQGRPVLGIDIAAPKIDTHRDVYRNVDIMDSNALGRVFDDFRPEAVLHFAAHAELEERKGLAHFDANIAGVQNVINAVRVTGGVKRSIFASTRLVFDIGYVPRSETDYHASTLYGVSKAKGEDLVRAASDDLGTWTIVRPTGIWGPWFGEPYRNFFEMVERGWYVNPSRRPAFKGYGYVENSVYQLQKMLEAPKENVHGETFWLADYEPVLVADWAARIADEWGSGPIRDVPFPLLRAASVLGDGLARIGVRFPMTSFRLNNLTTDMTFDMSATEAVVGPLPFSLEEGTSRTIDWLRSQR